jgi:hypothetical protein
MPYLLAIGAQAHSVEVAPEGPCDFHPPSRGHASSSIAARAMSARALEFVVVGATEASRRAKAAGRLPCTIAARRERSSVSGETRRR